MNPEASAETRLAAARRALARDEAEKRLAAALRAALESSSPPAPPQETRQSASRICAHPDLPFPHRLFHLRLIYLIHVPL